MPRLSVELTTSEVAEILERHFCVVEIVDVNEVVIVDDAHSITHLVIDIRPMPRPLDGSK